MIQKHRKDTTSNERSKVLLKDADDNHVKQLLLLDFPKIKRMPF